MLQLQSFDYQAGSLVPYKDLNYTIVETWIAHAAFLAKHRLKDMPLALKYAHALQEYTTAKDVPYWAKEMEIFIREDMNELETARLMIGGLIASGKITDPSELKFLNSRLLEIEARMKKAAKNKKR